jgi:acetyl esterase/lipase
VARVAGRRYSPLFPARVLVRADLEEAQMSRHRRYAQIVVIAVCALGAWSGTCAGPALAAAVVSPQRTDSEGAGALGALLSASNVRDVATQTVDSAQYSVAIGTSLSGAAYCPPPRHAGSASVTYYVVGGGYVMGGSNGSALPSATASYPTTLTNGWRVTVSDPSTAPAPAAFRVRAECLAVTVSSGG